MQSGSRFIGGGPLDGQLIAVEDSTQPYVVHELLHVHWGDTEVSTRQHTYKPCDGGRYYVYHGAWLLIGA